MCIRDSPPTRFEDEPRYVNAKQYARIMKMREKRLRQPERPKPIRKYKHESRHIHAKRRERCSNGRFVSKAEWSNSENKGKDASKSPKQLNPSTEHGKA
eukprot:TRINITY_DN5774_c0_g7_i1.p1 TRINITY_DN5774_c0_g7~~TRINITY_DN5774_c0_g7_i1.p1  ORF type:complete len:114 (-),score=25.86 TRINITY_DN5774_c0_g7_i1:196-492(-)